VSSNKKKKEGCKRSSMVFYGLLHYGWAEEWSLYVLHLHNLKRHLHIIGKSNFTLWYNTNYTYMTSGDIPGYSREKILIYGIDIAQSHI